MSCYTYNVTMTLVTPISPLSKMQPTLIYPFFVLHSNLKCTITLIRIILIIIFMFQNALFPIYYFMFPI